MAEKFKKKNVGEERWREKSEGNYGKIKKIIIR